jgi:hypothetical protein
MKLSLKAAGALTRLVGGLIEHAPGDDPDRIPEIELDDLDGKILVSMRGGAGEQATSIGIIASDGTYEHLGYAPHLTPPEPPKEAKAKNLRVGYGVWAEGAPAASRIHSIRREDPAHPGKIVAYVDWGHLVYEPDEIVKVDAPVLHPQILDSTATEIGLGSLIAGGDHPDGEVVEIVEPDESHWRVRVQWPEFDEPETFDAIPPPGGHDEPLFASDIVAAS